MQKKTDSKSGGEGTKEGNGTQETNGFIHNVILQHVRCVIRQSTETIFMVLVCVWWGWGWHQKLNDMVQHPILVKRRYFPCLLLLSGSAEESGQQAGKSGKAQCCVLLAGAQG